MFKVYQNLCQYKSEAVEETSSLATGSSGEDTDRVLSSMSSASSFTNSSAGSNDDTSTECAPLISSRPVPKEFPIELCDFGYHAKEIIRTGVLTEAGKREVTTELIKVMNKFERYVECG